MAVLSKIRQRSILLIGVIGFCLLAFVVGDVIQNGGFSQTSRNVGSVNGEDISAQEFLQRVSMAEKNGQGMSNTQAANGVWDQEVKRILLEGEYEKLGLKIGKDQLLNVMKQNPNFAQNPQFLNSAGIFDINKFNEYLATIKSSQPEQWNAWLDFEKQVEQMATEQMYTTMIKSGLVTTKVEAKAAYANENDKIDFDFVTVAYSTIKDDQVKVSDSEIMDYMKKNEKKYKSENSRDIEFVFIENKPSAADEAEMKTTINGLLSGRVVYNDKTGKNDTLPGFKAAVNAEEFVNANSDIKYDSSYIAKKDLPLENQEQLFNLPQGEVFGPYIHNGHYCLSKMLGRQSGSSAKVSHILLSYEGSKAPAAVKRTKEEAKAKADELLAQVKANPGSFPMLAMMNTDDTGSKQNGGSYDNVTKGQMVKPFNDFLFNNPVGAMGIVETEFGYHVIKVDAKYDAVRLATVARKIEPSETTADQIYTKATKFEADANEKDFAAVAKEAKLTVKPASVKGTDEYLPEVGAQRSVVSWAFNKDTEVGDVKKFDNMQGHIIARVKAKNETGLMSVEQAKAMVEPILKNKKKAELIKAKMVGSTLEAVAQKSGATVSNAVAVALANPSITNVGYEPKVVGKAFGLGAGKTSKLIDGEMGVYMIRTKAVAKAPALPDYATYVTRLKSQSQGSASGRAVMALKNAATIEDNRVEFQ
ncbi:peptidyl-prolyl cis-trans isomerase [Flavobacterium enshiense DK69]|uniref:Periplasmic chaperone PpiD n=1 Tax=Flavobacterium enshiense DK69 TaxID=1107311 RepID=V6S3Q1_9FLAO|nr:peptidylprolyl isomerase [Flavobacterium enshiense]ESU21044.1 peptidyl-prolyl cis-trans isomerase [Flavobacterium enshiense DK69]KGO95302.1 peptidylprolyl isomerase [Flavobacterium enshiense DK69]